MTDFIPGLTLAEAFYREAARPLLDTHFPALKHSAALIGWGSDVLGYDDARSTDHFWGPRFYLFLSEPDRLRYRESLAELFGAELPHTFRGYPTNFAGEYEGDVLRMKAKAEGAINPQIYCESIEHFFGWYLGRDPFAQLTPADWLTFSEHKLLGATGGRVFHDELGLEDVRRKFAYYPRGLWLWLLAAQWLRLSEEEAFVGRCGEAGDELGSALVAARQAKNLMYLCFLMERRYAPYGKWFGTAFARLPCAAELAPVLQRVLGAASWREREAHLSRAYERVARLHNALGLTPPLDAEVSDYYGRPYKVLHADRFAEAILRSVTEEERAPLRHCFGSVNQLIDSPNAVSNNELCRRLRALYE